MKEKLKLIYIMEFIILIFTIISKFIILRYIQKYNSIIDILFFGIITFILIIKCGFFKDNNYLKRYSTRISIITLMSLIIISYSIGIITGFAKPLLGYSLITILKNIIPIIILILEEEYIRYTICRNTNHKKLPIVLYTILIIILNIIIAINYNVLTTSREIFVFMCVTILPLISQEMLYSYITYNTSIKPTLIIKICLNIYIYILPIYPVLGDFISSVMGVTYPFIVFILIRNGVKYNDKGNVSTKKITNILLTFPLLLVTVALTILVSGILRFKMIAIASGSMSGTFERGDAVVYDKKRAEDPTKLKEGEIIAFEKEGIVVTHRIKKITIKNNVVTIKTKGDANDSEDAFSVDGTEVLGVINYKVDFIGYPTIWLTEFFNKNR